MPEQTARSASRRQFLAAAPPEAPARLPTVPFGEHSITRLIIGSNPLYGGSHFNSLFSRMMKEWMTDDRRQEVLRRAEASGIGTWQMHYAPQPLEDIRRYRAAGGRMNMVLLSDSTLTTNPELIPEAAKLGFLGIAYHGVRTDECFRNGQMHVVREWLKRVRGAGVRVGVSTHNPAVIDYIDGQDWDIDYYMTSFYRFSRTVEEARAEIGEAPIGERYLERDPERMTRMIRQSRRQCLAFKILGAGRATDRPEQVEGAFRYAFSNIKPGDAVIVGMFPLYKDEMRENAELARRLGAARAS